MKLLHENSIFWNSEVKSDISHSEIISFDFTEKSL